MKYNLVILTFIISNVLAAQNTGINTTNPNMALHVFKAADTALLQLENGAPLTGNSSAGMYLKNGNYFTGAIKTIGTGTNVARLGFFTFAAGSTSGLKERLSISDDGRVGINNNTPATTLDINGNFRLTDGTQANRKILTSDASGSAGWTYSDPVSFSATRVSTVPAIPANTASTNVLNLIEYETFTMTPAFNINNNTYTVPASGLYHIDLSIEINPSGTGSDVSIAIQKNGNTVRSTYSRVPVQASFVVAVSADVQAVAGDVISLRVFNGTNNNIFISTGTATYFSGHLVR